MDQQSFLNLLASSVQNEVSDIHLQVGSPPGFRLKGDLVNLKSPALTDKDILVILGFLIQDPKARAKIAELQDYDGSFEVKNLARFRVNVMKNQGRLGVVMDQSSASFTMPIVKVFFDSKALQRITPEIVDLSMAAPGERISRREDPAKWNFPDINELWSGLPGLD